ncbi:MAG: Gfo/Idh/MocA family protein [Haloechinothrix sp.]
MAVVGAGLMGMRHARVLVGLPGVQLTAVVDPSPEVLQGVGRTFDVWTTDHVANLPEIDGAIVASPDNAHRAVTVELLARGVSVLVEKPLATTVEDATAMLDAAHGTTLLMVGHLLRFDPRYLQARREFTSGRLGDLLHVYARRNSARGAVRRYGTTTRLHWHVSVHDVDLVRWVTGREIVEVTARGVSRRSDAAGQLDSLVALLSLDNGCTAVVESCWSLPPHLRSAIDARFSLVGTDGWLEVSGFQQGLTVVDSSSVSYPDTTRYAEYDDGAGGGILAAQLAHFVRCVEGYVSPLFDPTEALAAVRVVAAIERSLTTGAPVGL